MFLQAFANTEIFSERLPIVGEFVLPKKHMF